LRFEDLPLTTYPALFEPDSEAGGLVVTFPDFSYGVTQGETEEEAAEMATDLLTGLVSDRIKAGEDLPRPGTFRGPKRRRISLPAIESLKAELYVAFRSSGVTKAELARRLGIPKTVVDRLFDFRNHSRLDHLEAAFAVLGKRIEIGITDPA
jgi:antitoxin HicB